MKLILSFISILLSVLMVEIWLRIIDFDYNPNPNWRFDSKLGWTQEKGQEYKVQIQDREVVIEFNSSGFRDREHTYQKPDGTRRLVILGDSFSEAVQVNLEKTYWYRLKELLNRDSSEPWEVINLGVGDFGQAQAWLALTEHGFRFSPDLVISQVFPLNDICNNSIELLGLCKSSNDRYRPYFKETSDGNLVIVHGQPIRHFLRSHSFVFGVIEKSVLSFQEWLRNESVEEEHQRLLADRGYPETPLLYTYVPDSEQIRPVANGWRLTELGLQRTASACRERGVGWLAVIIPFHARVGEGWLSFKASHPAIGMIRDYPEERLGKFFGQQGMSAVSLLPVFEENIQTFLPPIGGHLNAGAHELAAETIFSHLQSTGLLDRIVSE